MLIIRKEAEQDIQSAFEWYQQRQASLGQSFLSEIEAKLDAIENRPALYGDIGLGVRRAICHRFPYYIYFIDNEAQIIVIGVLHQRRHPAVWQART